MGETAVILMVDDNPANLKTGKNALSGTYVVHTAPSVVKMFLFLEATLPDLILLDVSMPDMDGYEAIRMLKGNERTAHIPVIFLTGRTDEESEVMGLDLGAVDYITKPFVPNILLKHVTLHLMIAGQQRKLEEQAKILERQQMETLGANQKLREEMGTTYRQVENLKEKILKNVRGLQGCPMEDREEIQERIEDDLDRMVRLWVR